MAQNIPVDKDKIRFSHDKG